MVNRTTIPLIDKNLIFIEETESKDKTFKRVADYLLEKKVVKRDFIKNLEEREKNYPTGIDMSVINNNYPNVAMLLS
ncbi:PTS sugar transporter subunit IIA [Liquorilactobacillus satsumensis]|uniref:PTS sugar transporter subunit IIA n=1 Tax=Liquorilactobacillus satsumensis TaxID=259059 RepID=UPI0039ED2D76